MTPAGVLCISIGNSTNNAWGHWGEEKNSLQGFESGNAHRSVAVFFNSSFCK